MAEEQPEKERRFNQEQYDRLKKCSDKKDMTDWNQWRKDNPDEEIWLQGAYFKEAKLQGANLNSAKLQGAYLHSANLQGTELVGAKLQGAYFFEANLKGAYLFDANLQEAEFGHANLERAILEGAKLQGAKFRGAIVNGSTDFLYCSIDEDTDFRETGLENVCIEFGIKIRLKYNIRRMNWRDWYKEHRFLQWPVKLFWSISNYGISTLRIFTLFIGSAITFALVYLLWPCCVMVNNVVGDIRGFVHALYFSVVTMTTLGFGDIAANPDSWQGQVILMVQVIFGYVLLGALVTRLAVLFTSDGPAGSFTPMDKETKELLAKLKEDKGN